MAKKRPQKTKPTEVDESQMTQSVPEQALIPDVIDIDGIECYERDGVVYLKLEPVARGLGFTHAEKKNGAAYETIRWERVFKFLDEIGFAHLWAKDGFIPENVFYRLAMKAKSAVAKAFQVKVADEVIPAIRRTGMYMTPTAADQFFANPDTIIRMAVEWKKEREQRLALAAKVARDAPAVLFAESIKASKDTILVGDLAKLLRQRGIKIGQNRLYTWLREKGYLIKRTGETYNMPTQRAMEMGLFEIQERTIFKPNGEVVLTKTARVTGKGQEYFVNLFLKMDSKELTVTGAAR